MPDPVRWDSVSQQVAARAAAASVSFAECRHALEVRIDQLAHPAFEERTAPR
jgi:hypothetical protein